jgi:glycosyltransferase involved in cell wall biosynthesis
MTVIPVGVDTRRFTTTVDRHALRQKHGIADSTFVMLVISNVERVFKRVDYIIEEVSRLEGDILLWIDGHPEDPTLPELARQKLGSRCRITYVASNVIPELYQTADVMIHASVNEAFGLAVVEALCSGLTVLAHDCPHFEWLIGHDDSLVDMSRPGTLEARLKRLPAERDEISRRAKQCAADVCRRFDWHTLVPAYVQMYQTVAASA